MLLLTLQKVQNDVIRFIFGISKGSWQYGVSISQLRKKLHFLPIEFRVKYKIALLAFKCIKGIAPSYLKQLISLRDLSSNVYDLRHSVYLNCL